MAQSFDIILNMIHKLSQIPLVMTITFLCSAKAVAADGLLIERNGRPLLSEGAPEALEPWETPLDGFFTRTHHNVIPNAADDQWTVAFDGLIKSPQRLTVAELKKYQAVSFHAVLECSGNGRGFFSPPVSGIQWLHGAIGNAEWTGVPLTDILKRLEVSKDAVYATFEGFDEPVMKSDAKFVRSIPLQLLADTRAILAWNMNRVPMPILHGGPIRLVLPDIYGQNWVKWVNKVIFTKEPDHRMFARKAYRIPDHPVKPGEAWDPVKQGKPIEYLRVQSFVTYPAPNATVAPGELVIKGKTFSGSGHIVKLEVSLDGGATWQTAELSPGKDHAWQEFKHTISVKDGTSLDIWTRATDAKIHVQPLTQEWNPKGYLYNAVDRIHVTVAKDATVLALGEELTLKNCQTCHSFGIIDGQRLKRGEWVKVVKHMADFGLKLSDDESESIATYLAKRVGQDRPIDNSKPVELNANPSLLVPNSGKLLGNAARGKGLFGSYCAGCHGSDAKGNIGPFLKGRMLTDANFWFTVLHGKRNMPAFAQILKAQQIADIKAWIVINPLTEGEQHYGKNYGKVKNKDGSCKKDQNGTQKGHCG